MFSKCRLTFGAEIKWHQFITRKTRGNDVVYLCRAVFWPVMTSCLCWTRPNLLPVMQASEEKQCHLRCWEMLQWRRWAPELKSSWADILSQDMEGKGHFAWMVHHYHYLPARIISLMNFDSFCAGKCRHESPDTQMRTELEDWALQSYCINKHYLKTWGVDVKMHIILFVELESQIFMQKFWLDFEI